MKAYKEAFISAFKKAGKGVQATLLNYLYTLYKTRVEADSGTINNVTITQDAYKYLPQLDSIKFAWMAGAGSKKRTSTIYSYFTKLYSLDTLAVHNDATQTTEASQPRVTGNIAPGDVEALQNATGETRSMTHPDIVIAETYTITRCEATNTTGKTIVTHTEVNSATLNTITPSGYLSAYIVRQGTLTAGEKASEAAFLLSKYPEIPQVTIGSQTWALRNCDMVATPQGNDIANVTENANVEKITVAADREFSSETGWWTKGTGWAIGSGVASSDGSQTDVSNLSRETAITTNKWHKVVFTVSGRTAGTIKPLLGTATITAIAANGTYTYYIKSVGTTLIFQADADFVGSIDNVSCGEVGWAGSQELYDGIYAQTTGTVEEKTYAAVKAAAMWCFYNNSADNGAIYGKLYNWVAVKLLQMDIDYYNAANPTTPWGWRCSLDADQTTLDATVTNNADALKKEGTNYWAAGNNGTNSSGLTILGSGYRNSLGTFSCITGCAMLWNADDNISSQEKIQGFSTRLIKT